MSESTAEGGSGSDQALTVASEPKRELALAKSIETARHDQLMLIDQRGKIASRFSIQWSFAKLYFPIGIGIGIGGSLLGLGIVPLALAASASSLGLVGWLRWRWRPFQRAQHLIVSGRLDEAQAVLEAFAKRPPSGAYVELQLARVAFLQGRTQDAAALYGQGAARIRKKRNFAKMPAYWLALAGRGSALAVLGATDEARAVRSELDDAPPGGLFERSRHYIDLRVAFAEQSLGRLADEDLYDWASEALATNLFGATLSLLAWAFEQSGDREMALHALVEAPERLRGAFLKQSDPQLHRFMIASWSDWNASEEHGELTIP